LVKEPKRSECIKKGRTWLGVRPLCFLTLLKTELGSLDSVNGAAVNASTTVSTGGCVNHVLVTLLADGVNRASVRTGGAVDTLVINCVSHGTFLLLIFFEPETWGVYRNEGFLSRAKSHKNSLKKLAN